MTREEAIRMAKAKLKCLEASASCLSEVCNNDCDNCSLTYEQGNMGEQKEWLKMLITAFEQGPIYFPPCVDCNTKMNEIREVYDKMKNQLSTQISIPVIERLPEHDRLEGMTNGDMIRAVLDPRTDQVIIYGDSVEIEIQKLGIYFSCETSWWNAPYKEVN